mmetsp:Transcript_66393/g.104474  ORF Transcript_66393/g.104474 Transcript_66393/m.104474 type:complete len:235 (-) Transcript_66393:635-1339(-)
MPPAGGWRINASIKSPPPRPAPLFNKPSLLSNSKATTRWSQNSNLEGSASIVSQIQMHSSKPKPLRVHNAAPSRKAAQASSPRVANKLANGGSNAFSNINTCLTRRCRTSSPPAATSANSSPRIDCKHQYASASMMVKSTSATQPCAPIITKSNSDAISQEPRMYCGCTHCQVRVRTTATIASITQPAPLLNFSHFASPFQTLRASSSTCFRMTSAHSPAVAIANSTLARKSMY